ncbi:uncharacterized protein LOC128306492 [Anopheles moucheti]|uniref:uncharacterized protein LOC128306492 n=1 Tax=Anopheles moucheti TaxID=186751 RepID=UPI0022F0A003|nr:uncharacterized protein LOC128306492 [Anopheles moucheti]
MAIECPVCTLFLRSGMSLAEHLDTHPKENVIKALVNIVKNDGLSYYHGALEELGRDEIIPLEGNTSSIGTAATASNALTIRTNERTTALGIYETQPMYMDNAILAASSNAVQATVSQPSQFTVVKAIDAHGIPSFQLNNVTLIKREIVQPVATPGLSTISTVAAATATPTQPATIGTVQTDLSGVGPMGEEYLESVGNGTGEAGSSSRVVGPTVASTTVYPRYTNELYSGPPPPYSRAISSTVATNTHITPMQQQTVQLNLPKSNVNGVAGQQMQLLSKLHPETSSSAFKQYPSNQATSDRGVDESAVTVNLPPTSAAPKSAYSATAPTVATTAITTASSTSSLNTSLEQPPPTSTPQATLSPKSTVPTPSKANVVKVISNVKVQSKLKDIQEIILQLNAGQMSIVGDKTTLIPPTTERRASAFAPSASGRSLLAIAPVKAECSTTEQQQIHMSGSSMMEVSEEQNDGFEEHMAADYDHEEEYGEAWQDDDNYVDDEIREQWEDDTDAKRFCSSDEQGELHSAQSVTEEKPASVTIASSNACTNSTSSSSAMETSVIRKTPQPLPCTTSPTHQEAKSQIKRLVFRMADNSTPTNVSMSPTGPPTSPKIVRAWQGLKVECSSEGTSITNNTTTTSVTIPAEEEMCKPMSCASSALAGRDYAAKQKQRFRPPKKLAIKPKRTQAEGGLKFPTQRPVDGDVHQRDEVEMTGTNSETWTDAPATTIALANALSTLAEVVCTNATAEQSTMESFSSTSFNGITAVIQKTDTSSGITTSYACVENALRTQQLLMTPIKQEHARMADNPPAASDVASKPLTKPNQMLDVRAPYTYVPPGIGAVAPPGGHKRQPKDEIDVGAYNISYVSETGETIYHPLPKKGIRTIGTPRSESECATVRPNEETASAEYTDMRGIEKDELIGEDVKVCSTLQGDEEDNDDEDEKEPTNEIVQEAEVVYEERLDSDDDDYDDVFEMEPIAHQQNPSTSSPSPDQQQQQLLMLLTRVNNKTPPGTVEQNTPPTNATETVETEPDLDTKDRVQHVSESDYLSGEQSSSYRQSDKSINLSDGHVMKRFHSGLLATVDEKDLLEAGPSSRTIVHAGVPRPKIRVTNADPFHASGRTAPIKTEKDERKKSGSGKRKCGKDFLEAEPSSSLSTSSHRFASGSVYEDGGDCLGHNSFINPITGTIADERMYPESGDCGLKTAKTEPYVEDEQDTTTSSFLDLNTMPKNSLDGMTNDTASITSHSSSHSGAGLGKDSGEGSGISSGTRSLLPSGSSIASTSMERAPSTESFNIRTDEKMPAKGEISEQESNGDMDVTSWNHRMYAVGENVPIYPSSYDLSTAQECWNLSSRNQGMFPVTDHFYYQQQHSGGNNTHTTTVSNQYMTSRVAFQFSSTSHQHLQQHGPELPFGGGIMTGKVEPQQDDDNDNDDVDEQAEGPRVKNAIPKMPFADMLVARMHEPPGAYDEVVTHHHQQQQTCETKYDAMAGTTSYFGMAAATCSMSAGMEPVLANHPKPSGSGLPRTFRCTLCPKVFDSIKQRRVHQQREHPNELLSLASHTQQEQGEERSGEGRQNQQKQVYQQQQPITVVMNYDWMKQEIQRKNEATLNSSRVLMSGGCSSSSSTIAVPGTSSDEMQQQLVVAQVKTDEPMADGSMGLMQTMCSVARNRSYVCSTCHQKFDRFNLFNEHLLEHPVECFACGRHFKQWRNFSLHIKRHLGIKEHQCRICSKQFVVKQKLIEHMRVHTGHAPIKCKLCNRTFKRFSNLAQHRKRYHMNRTVTKEDYVCQLCGEVFHSQAKMEWHKETHEKKPKSCPYCREKFIHRNSLTRHIRLSHTDKYAMLENKTEPCNICQQPYTKTSMRRHMETHTTERMAYACGICNKRFTTNWNLKQHKWTHANPTMKPFQCTHCPSAFVRESDFVTHVNAHRSIRPYTCNYCGSQFIRKYNWIRHTREHESDKGHRCDVCGRQFHRKYYLTEHKRIHTGERPFACNICGKTSATKTNHNKHVRIHHARDPLTAEG